MIHQRCKGRIVRIRKRMDEENLVSSAENKLEAGEVGRVDLKLEMPVVHDDQCSLTPLAILVLREAGRAQNAGLGIIRHGLRKATNVRRQDFLVDKGARAARMGQKPFVLWFTGLSDSGKSTVAGLVEKYLNAQGKKTYLLDGDNLRHGLNRDLGFTHEDRIENMRRIAEVARLMTDAGLIVLVASISPFRAQREKIRQLFEKDEFMEVFVDTPLEVCEERDSKGLYAKARAGMIRNFTGIDSPYEPPAAPEIHLNGASLAPEEMARQVLRWLKKGGYI